MRAPWAATLLAALSIGSGEANDTFIPASGDTVVETLRDRPLNRSDLQFRELRAALRARPGDPALATAVAERAIELSRRDGDPRYLGYAEAALAPWRGTRDPPLPIRLARATVLQSVHRFDDALRELDPLLEQQPDQAQALLTRASILQVQGKWVDAADSCARLRPVVIALVRAACLAELSSLSTHVAARLPSQAGSGVALDRRGAGQSAAAGFDPRQRAIDALRELQRLAAVGAASGDDAVDGWLHLMIAELAERVGDAAAAEAAFRRAMTANPDAYTRGAFADFLLDRRRDAEVVAVLEGYERTDALLLRLTLAQLAVDPPAATRNHAVLRSRFDAARLRGGSVHQREEARFELELERRPDVALALALANWAVQKEPADTLLLLQAARAADRSDAAKPARDLIDEHRFYDRRLLALSQ